MNGLRKATISSLMLLAVLTVLTVGCSKSSGGGGATSNPYAVSIVTGAAAKGNMSFSPSPFVVKVGTTITWTNTDSNNHTVTSDTGAFDSGNLSAGQSYSFTFNAAGTFNYHCGVHPSMTGSVVVQ